MLTKIRRKIKDIKNMSPRIRKYGLRYLFDREFRRKKKQKEHGVKNRKKYGSAFLTKRKMIKDDLIKRDGKKCQRCKFGFPAEKLTIDHKIRLRDGGTNQYNNLQLLCNPCHVFKDKEDTGNRPFANLQELIDNHKK